MARRAAFISQVRNSGAVVLLLDAGDALTGEESPSLQDGGALVVRAMNLMEYDAAALGAGDLSLGVDLLRQRMQEAEFPFVSANVYLADGDALFAEPYVLLPAGGHTVGVLGLTNPAGAVPPGWVVSDPLAAAEHYLPELAARADVVIVLSHLGWAQNVQLAGLAAGVDLIVGGGADEPGSQPFRSAVTGTYLAQADQSAARHAGRYIGEWSLLVDAGGRVTTSNWRPVPLDPGFVDDPAIAALLGL